MIQTLLSICTVLLMTLPVNGQAAPKAAGELVSVSQTTINGLSAIAGSTVFSNNRIRTEEQGSAIINLGKLGRVELDSKTDLILKFSAGSLNGELHTGRAIFSAPTGVAISVSTPRGVITTDSRPGAMLSLEVDSRGGRFVIHRGEAGILSGAVLERVREGEEIVLDSKKISKTRSEPLARSQTIPTLASLIGSGVEHSMARVISNEMRNTDHFFEATITCRDYYHRNCRKRGSVTP